LCVRAIVALMIHKPEALARSRRQWWSPGRRAV